MVRLRFIVAKAALIFRPDPGGRRRPYFFHKQQGSPLSFPEIFRCLQLPPGDPWQFYFGSAYKSSSARLIVVKAALIFRPDPGVRRRPYFRDQQQGSTSSFPDNFRCLRLLPGIPWQFYFGSAYMSGSVFERILKLYFLDPFSVPVYSTFNETFGSVPFALLCPSCGCCFYLCP